MRLKVVSVFLKFFLLAGGFILLGVALFANPLGIDHNGGWGRGRISLALAGSFLLCLGLGLSFLTALRKAARKALNGSAAHAARTASSRLAGSRLVQAVRAGSARLKMWPPLAWFNPARVALLAGGSAVLIIVAAYLWYITGGSPFHWTDYQAYYNRLADAFQEGRLSLLDQPSPELLALKNPYDYHNREGISYLWDASLYDGKYYYYWGPVPALIICAVRWVKPAVVQDQYLVFAFCSGLALVSALLLARLRKIYFPGAPAWTLFPLTLLCGLAMPVFWLINHPNVYETAISGGQFFLLLGLYGAARAFEPGVRQPARSGWLLLAGFAWGAAVNCRASLVLAVVFLAGVASWQILREREDPTRRLLALVCLGVPLALWAAGMGWYNAARFGSILETGHRYQLTGMALPAGNPSVLSLKYLLPNFYTYFLRPPAQKYHSLLTISLPFIQEKMWPFFIRLPEQYYYSEQVASILAVVPGIGLVFLPLLGLAQKAWLWLNEREPGKTAGHLQPAWLWWSAAGGAAAALLPILAFISASMRYLADATPLLTLLAALSFWWGLRFLRGHPWLRAGLVFAACVLALISVAASLLVVFYSQDMRFEAIHPVIYARMGAIFR